MWVFDIAEMFHAWVHRAEDVIKLPVEPMTTKEFSVVNKRTLRQMGINFCAQKNYDIKNPIVRSGMYNGVESYLVAKKLWKEGKLTEPHGTRFGKADKR